MRLLNCFLAIVLPVTPREYNIGQKLMPWNPELVVMFKFLVKIKGLKYSNPFLKIICRDILKLVGEQRRYFTCT